MCVGVAEEEVCCSDGGDVAISWLGGRGEGAGGSHEGLRKLTSRDALFLYLFLNSLKHVLCCLLLVKYCCV